MKSRRGAIVRLNYFLSRHGACTLQEPLLRPANFQNVFLFLSHCYRTSLLRLTSGLARGKYCPAEIFCVFLLACWQGDEAYSSLDTKQTLHCCCFSTPVCDFFFHGGGGATWGGLDHADVGTLVWPVLRSYRRWPQSALASGVYQPPHVSSSQNKHTQLHIAPVDLVMAQ